jgi:cellulose synthase operon protein C
MPNMRPSNSLALLAACALAACASKRAGTPDNEPTLKTLAGRTVVVEKDQGVAASEEKAIEAYRKFLEVAPRAPQRAEAMRRLGDLEMDSADTRSARSQAANADPDYRAAITRYQDYLKNFPNDPGNDRVLYQLARAYEQGGQLETALKTLDRLVAEYPNTTYREEAHFRRGELLFTTRHYAKAEQAYATVLKEGTESRYHDRALYMHGWSLFKQGRLDDALHSFFGVLDLKVANSEGDGDLDTLADLSRADRELVEDTFRVTSLCLTNLQGAESIAAYMKTDERRSYEFRVYQHLGELYIKQERVKDAADTFGMFARLHPLHAQAPVLQARVIDIYQSNGFGTLALQAKKEYVARYGIDSEFRRANEQGWEKAQPLVKAHLAELARHHHASAQKSKSSADYQEAVRWYRLYIASFPTDPDAAQNNFLLAELLFEDSRFAEASTEYEKTAYHYPKHAKSADAGYAALLGYAQQEKRAAPAELPALHRTSVASALRFAKEFPSDSRAGPVLTNAAEKLYALRDGEQASSVAQQVLSLDPPAAPAQRRVAWTVVAHTSFERGAFDKAERAYGEVIALTPDKDAARTELVERQAASIYKQGEQANELGDFRLAANHFLRIKQATPTSKIRAGAEYDAGAALIRLQDWAAATEVLDAYRRTYPEHELQKEATKQIAFVRREAGQLSQAAGEYERVAAESEDAELRAEALLLAGSLHEQSKNVDRALEVYSRYVEQFPKPVETAVETRFKIAEIHKARNDQARYHEQLQEIVRIDAAAGSERTGRTRNLAARSSLVLSEQLYERFAAVKLLQPFEQSLQEKRQGMDAAIQAFGGLVAYEVGEVTAAATFYMAEIYSNFSRSLVESERPAGLAAAALQDYEDALEEEAFPFEEKAIEVHEKNLELVSGGIYNAWTEKSLARLAVLKPGRYAKYEISSGFLGSIDRYVYRQPERPAVAVEAEATPPANEPPVAATIAPTASTGQTMLFERTEPGSSHAIAR